MCTQHQATNYTEELMYRKRGIWFWLASAALLPLFWFSGQLPFVMPTLAHGLFNLSPLEVVEWLAPLLFRITVIGFALSLLAGALGVESLRTLLTPRQALWTAILASAVLWVAWTGLFWAAVQEDEVAVFLWRMLVGASFDLFVLIWLILGTRAAAAVKPLRLGLTLVCSGVSLFWAAWGGLYVFFLILYHYQPEINLPIVGIFVLLLLALLLLPEALVTAGMAALFASLRQRLMPATSGRASAAGGPPPAIDAPPSAPPSAPGERS